MGSFLRGEVRREEKEGKGKNKRRKEGEKEKGKKDRRKIEVWWTKKGKWNAKIDDFVKDFAFQIGLGKASS